MPPTGLPAELNSLRIVFVDGGDLLIIELSVGKFGIACETRQRTGPVAGQI
jgi:hypothetical protein